MGGEQLADYLLTEDKNQKVAVLDQRGSLMDDLTATLHSWEMEARAVTKGQKPLYHMQLRLAPGEKLERLQWFHVLAKVEERLRLTDHPRTVVAHDLKGERHLHVVYSRLDRENGKLLSMGHDRQHMHAVSRQAEKEFGLRELTSLPRRDRNGNQNTRSAEYRMAKECQTTRHTLCLVLQAAWNASKTGLQFQEYLAGFGLTMSHGTRRDYNVWYKGKRYDPVRLIENIRTPEFRAKMQLDLPRDLELVPDMERPGARKASTHGGDNAIQPENTVNEAEQKRLSDMRSAQTPTRLDHEEPAPTSRRARNYSGAPSFIQNSESGDPQHDVERLKRELLVKASQNQAEQAAIPGLTMDTA